MRRNKTKLRLLTSTVNYRTIEKEVRVEFTKFAAKQIERLPQYIQEHVQYWIEAVKENLRGTRHLIGYHDEPLKGQRVGQRSIRLNQSWRLIYEEHEFEKKTYLLITVIEVNKHEY